MRGHIQRIHRLVHERGLANLSWAGEDLQKTPGLSEPRHERAANRTLEHGWVSGLQITQLIE